jgi:hypothetical protein
LHNHAAGWSAYQDNQICDLLHKSLGLEFHREGKRGPEVIGVSSKIWESHQAKTRPVPCAEKAQAHRFEVQCERNGWGKISAEALLRHSRDRLAEIKRLQKWREKRIEDTKKRKEREQKEKPGLKNLWKKNTQTHSY